jgi:hypothetical protein
MSAWLGPPDLWFPIHLLNNVWIVCGSRGYGRQKGERDKFEAELTRLMLIRKPQAIYSGGCRGPDRMAETWASDAKVLVVRVLADWSKRGKYAGPYRNEEMATRAEGGAAICFWDGRSRGTQDMMTRAAAHGMYLHVVRV